MNALKIREQFMVYDTAFLLMGIYHTIEWFRTFVLLMLTSLGGEWLLWFYYISMANGIYGLVAAVIAHYAYFSADGFACATAQPGRNQYLLIEIVFFYVIYTVSILFIVAYPKMAYAIAKMNYD